MKNKTQQNLDTNEQNDLETVIYRAISICLTTPYNWSLLLLTAIIWAFTGSIFPYSSNNNFDMTTEISGYMQYFSLAAIIYGLVKHNLGEALMTKKMQRLGIITYVLSLLTIIAVKNFGLVFYFGLLIVKPLSIFSFLLLVQAMWQLADLSNDKREQKI